ncbi:MAG TPA: AsmA-like C-terminal region-containing protein, partial [Burkholderiales bacterium]|nr:AsmA-like C-terminal region-containing protein [Burkholderiales bacterium]
RADHDIIAEAAQARRNAEFAQTNSQAIAARRQRMEEETRRETDVVTRKRRKRVLAGIGLAMLMVPALAIAYLQYTPLNGYIPEAQRALEERLNQPVSISTLRYVILPTPRLVLEGVAVGKSSGVRIERVSAHVMPWSVLAGPTSFSAVEAHGVEIESDMLGTLPAWTGGRAAGALHTDRLYLSAMKLKLAGAELEPVGGEIAFASNGTIKEATFSGAKVNLELTPRPEGVRVLLKATDWQIPYGPPFAFGLLTVRGLIDQGQIAAMEYTGRVAGGSLEGALTARWAGPVTMQGEFKVDGARLQDFAAELDANFSAKGTVRATGRYSMQAPTWTALAANPQVGASFVVTRGELTNLDIMRAIQSPALGALRGGRTGFEELSGTLQIGAGNYLFRQLQLTSGPLNASGTLDVAPGGQLNGRFVAELKARGARATLLLGGTVQDPQLKR